MTLEIEKVSLSYGAADILHELSLRAAPGEITCLVGPSGGGKSSLLRLIAGLEKLDGGEIRLDGNLLAGARTHQPPETRPVGMIFQDNALFPHMTIAENIAFGMRKSAGPGNRTVIGDLLGEVGLEGFENRYPHTLSGGQQQRVALVRALASDPSVILMDEPYANIDPQLRQSLREQARLALTRSGAITIMVTHDPEEALEMADYIAVLVAGRVVQCACPQEAYANPASLDVASLFGGAYRCAAQLQSGRAVTDIVAIDLPPGLCDGFAEGEMVDLVLRPDLLSVSVVDGALGEILDIRFSGNHWTVFVGRADGVQAPLRVHLEDPQYLTVGDSVSVQAHPGGAFLFAGCPAKASG